LDDDMIPIAANLSTLFREIPWPERFLRARAQGFDGVEIQSPYAVPADSLARAARGAELPVVLINGPVDAATRSFGIAGRLEDRSVFRAQLPMIEDYALALGVRYVHILAGQIDPSEEQASALEVYVENLAVAAERLAPRGVEVLIEPLNAHDAPQYLLASYELAVDVVRRCGPGVGLQFDIYHATRMGLDAASELERRLPIIRHIQFADVPGRHEPGSGDIAFERLLAKLLDVGYTGWLGAEYFPLQPGADAPAWLSLWRAWLRR
jgi:hydroxypyruvate isomerase